MEHTVGKRRPAFSICHWKFRTSPVSRQLTPDSHVRFRYRSHAISSTVFFLLLLRVSPLTLFTGLLILARVTFFLFLTRNSFNILVCHFYFNIPLKFSRINYFPLQKFSVPPVPYFHHGTLLCIFHFLSLTFTSTASDILFLTWNFASFQENSTWISFVDK